MCAKQRHFKVWTYVKSKNERAGNQNFMYVFRHLCSI
jgi:hypothetical protein